MMEQATLLDTLVPEIAFMRVKLARLIEYPHTPPELLLQAVRTIARMMDIQHRLILPRPRRKRR